MENTSPEDTAPGAAQMPATGLEDVQIVDVTVENFQDVVQESVNRPVIFDFWAEWCGPCKQLGPAIEKIVTEAGGAALLAKVDIDAQKEIAAQFRVQSIPTVMAVKEGRPVDGFVGALPESQIKDFVERLTGIEIGPSKADQLVEQGKAALDAGDIGAAMQGFGEAAELDDGHVGALAGLARCYLEADEAEAARNTLEMIPADKKNDPDVKAAEAALKLYDEAGAAEDTGPLGELKAAVEADPKNPDAWFAYATAAIDGKDYDVAIDALLQIMTVKRDWNDGAAKQKLFDLFELLGNEDERTVEGRRRLSTLLFA